MGCCISKCITNKTSDTDHPKLEVHDNQVQHQFSHSVQDKLVIISKSPNEASQIPLVITPNKLVISDLSRTPPSPSASISSSSASSFVTCTTSNTSIASSSSSSTSKDKSSFSNEFLWSCYKENPHISRINSLKEANKHNNNNNKVNSSSKIPMLPTAKTCPQKRIRPVSPCPNHNSSRALTRQKSFRRDFHQPAEQCTWLRQSSTPSPSRRFVANFGETRESHSRRVTASTNANYSIGSNFNLSSSSRKENIRPWLRSTSGSAREQRNVHRIRSKIDDIAVAKALACQEIENPSTEDINNPLISMDCFIFI